MKKNIMTTKKKIVFTNVEIRHYNLTLGNRLVERDLGPALTLDWTFSTSKSTPIDAYETESRSTVSSRRRGERLRLDVEDRISLLVDNFGVCANKLERAMKSGQKRLNRRHVLSPPVDPTKSFSSIDMASVEKSLKGKVRNTSKARTNKSCDKADLMTARLPYSMLTSQCRLFNETDLSQGKANLPKTKKRTKFSTYILKKIVKIKDAIRSDKVDYQNVPKETYQGILIENPNRLQ